MTQLDAVPDGPLGLAGRSFIVTGGGSGIGRCTVESLLALGAGVVAVDVAADALTGAGGDLTVVHGDAARPAVAEEALEAALARGSLDGAVFAAGTASSGSLGEIDLKTFDEDLARNLTVHLPLSQCVLRHRTLRPESAQCSLVYVASKHAVAPSSGFGGYPVAKGALLQLARLLAVEGAPLGVRVNTVNPGAVFDGSKFWDRSLAEDKARSHGVGVAALPDFYARRTLLGVRVTPADVANAILFLLSPLSRATTGAVLSVDGGLPVSFAR